MPVAVDRRSRGRRRRSRPRAPGSRSTCSPTRKNVAVAPARSSSPSTAGVPSRCGPSSKVSAIPRGSRRRVGTPISPATRGTTGAAAGAHQAASAASRDALSAHRRPPGRTTRPSAGASKPHVAVRPPASARSIAGSQLGTASRRRRRARSGGTPRCACGCDRAPSRTRSTGQPRSIASSTVRPPVEWTSTSAGREPVAPSAR